MSWLEVTAHRDQNLKHFIIIWQSSKILQTAAKTVKVCALLTKQWV